MGGCNIISAVGLCPTAQVLFVQPPFLFKSPAVQNCGAFLLGGWVGYYQKETALGGLLLMY